MTLAVLSSRRIRSTVAEICASSLSPPTDSDQHQLHGMRVHAVAELIHPLRGFIFGMRREYRSNDS